MDWADDITYAIHDVADFYVAGKIPLDRLGSLKDDAKRRLFFAGPSFARVVSDTGSSAETMLFAIFFAFIAKQ